MHILENPRWRIARAFQLKCLKNQARYEIAAKGFISYFKALLNEPRIFLLLLPLRWKFSRSIYLYTMEFFHSIFRFHKSTSLNVLVQEHNPAYSEIPLPSHCGIHHPAPGHWNAWTDPNILLWKFMKRIYLARWKLCRVTVLRDINFNYYVCL